jgi:PAS domain S-box-containing protein
VYVGLVEVGLEGRMLSVNERFCDLVERSPGALKGLRIQELMYEKDRAACVRALGRLAGGLGPFVQESRLTTPDGRVIWVEIAAAPLSNRRRPRSATLVVTDVTSRKRAEARARESNRRFREVADAAPVFIWTSGTDRKRRHTWVNTRWADFRGQPIEEELGSGWTRGVHPDDLPACLSTYSAAFDRRGPFVAEYRLARSDGEHRWVLDTGAPIHDEHGRFVGYIGSAIDITDRKAAEGEREALLARECAARADAERANQLKDEFLGILSHELRTPLNAVLGWAHLLQTSVDGSSELGRGLSVIERNARLQSRMVDDLLDMGGVITGKMRIESRRIALGHVIDAVLESLQPAFDAKSVRLRRIPAAGDVADVHGDPNRLHQIVWNLLSNALKFTPSGGEVVVELRRAAGRVSIVVRDSGQGIDPDFLPFVFDRFRQGDPSTRRRHGGLGIGLALVKSLAELHGGTVSATSEGAGRGATVTVSLPVSSDAARPAGGKVPILARGLKDRFPTATAERL